MFKSEIKVEKEWGIPRFPLFFFRLRQAVTIEVEHKNITGRNPP